MKTTQYPDTYLHVQELRSGEEWIMPIEDNDPMNLRRMLDKWAKTQLNDELEIDGDLMPKMDGDYYGKIMTDGRPPESVVCWDGAGFYMKPTYE